MAKRFSGAQRSEILKRDGHRCGYCGLVLKAAALEADHIIPDEKGGGTTVENGVASCRSCNRKKWHYLPGETAKRLLWYARRPVAKCTVRTHRKGVRVTPKVSFK